MSLTKICYSKKALDVFSSEIIKFGEIETGGSLIGYTSGNTIFVEKASNGGKNAIHEALYFRADPNYVDMFIDMEVANSNGRYRYLGEWHTHPEIIPSPSTIDLQSLNEIAMSSDDFCMLLIIGNYNFKSDLFASQSISIIKEKKENNAYVLKSLAINSI